MKQPPKWITGIVSTLLLGMVTTVTTLMWPEDDALMKLVEKQNETITMLQDLLLAEAMPTDQLTCVTMVAESLMQIQIQPYPTVLSKIILPV